MVRGCSTIIVAKKVLFDLPLALLHADAELQVFARNGIPVLWKEKLAILMGPRQ